VSLEINRLHLGGTPIGPGDTERWPVHGFVSPIPTVPPGQAADEDSWHASVNRMRALSPAQVHFCHHTDVVHG